MSFDEDSNKTLESIHQDNCCRIPSASLSAQQQSQTPRINHPSLVHSSKQQGIPINYQGHSYNHRPYYSCLPNSSGAVSVSENDSVIHISADYSSPSLNYLDFQLMNIDPNMSPSSGITSPMDLGFTNISDEQSIDNIDLNNIMPSIKMASSLTLLGPNDFSSRGSNDGGLGDNNDCRGMPLLKSNLSKTSRGFDGNDLPSASCPTENSDAAYLSAGGSFESPTGALSIPRTGGCGGNASGGSGASSLTGTWGGSSLTSLSGAPNLSMLSGSTAGNDNQRVAMIKARTKKDSHNLIERKRRDYINCQITELGSLLPDEMFRESDSKKNKGNILKNSVEYVAALQRESLCYSGLYNEATLANIVIGRLIKRIQDLESLLPPEYLAKVGPTGAADYQQILQEWSKLHNINEQKIPSGTPAAAVGGTTGQVSIDTGESPPVMSSVGNNDDTGICSDVRGYSNSPVPTIGRLGRTRCTSASSTSAHQTCVGVTNSVDVATRATPSLVGSLPSHGARILLASSPPNSTQGCGRLMPIHPLFSQLYTSGSCAKHPSPPSGRIAGKRVAVGRPLATKMEERGAVAVPKQGSISSTINEGGIIGCDGFMGLSASLPVRMTLDEFSSTLEMNSGEHFLSVNAADVEGGGREDSMETTFQPGNIMDVSCDSAISFHSRPYQHRFVCGDGVLPILVQRLPRPLSAGQHQQEAAETPSTQQAGGMSDELQFDHAI